MKKSLLFALVSLMFLTFASCDDINLNSISQEGKGSKEYQLCMKYFNTLKSRIDAATYCYELKHVENDVAKEMNIDEVLDGLSKDERATPSEEKELRKLKADMQQRKLEKRHRLGCE